MGNLAVEQVFDHGQNLLERTAARHQFQHAVAVGLQLLLHLALGHIARNALHGPGVAGFHDAGADFENAFSAVGIDHIQIEWAGGALGKGAVQPKLSGLARGAPHPVEKIRGPAARPGRARQGDRRPPPPRRWT